VEKHLHRNGWQCGPVFERPHFSNLLRRQSVFGGGTRLRSLRGVFSDPPKSGLWRGVQRWASRHR
jgi:hypothetical protein